MNKSFPLIKMEVLCTITLVMSLARKIFNYVNKRYSFFLIPSVFFIYKFHHFVHRSSSFPLTLPWKSLLLRVIGQLGGIHSAPLTLPFLRYSLGD